MTNGTIGWGIYFGHFRLKKLRLHRSVAKTDSGQTYAKGPCLQIAPPCHGDDDARTAVQPTAMMQVLAGGFGAPEWGVRALGPLRHSLDIIIIAARGAGTTSRGRRGATPAEPATTVWCGA